MNYRLAWRHRSPPLSIESLRLAAQRKLPQLAWSYLEGGAEELITLKENMSGFRRWRLRQRCLTGVGAPTLEASMVGMQVAMPLALAPTGASGLQHWSGDIAIARAAERAGTRHVLSTGASYTLEEVADATQENHWFQLYPFGNRARVAALMDRARTAGYTALFVTVDVPVLGNREAERAAGMTMPWTLTPRRALNVLMHPYWLRDLLTHRRIAAIHYLEPEPDGSVAPSSLTLLRRAATGASEDAARSAEAMSRYMQSDLDWDDLAWMRDRWQGPLYVKGVLDADDAEFAVDKIGVDGVVVSNHGGRQLDRCLSSIDALPAIVARIGNRAEVYLDGGIRRGTDVITALCLGARGVFIGRPYLYGLAAKGEQGVADVLEIFRDEIARALTLMGCPSISALDSSWLIRQEG